MIPHCSLGKGGWIGKLGKDKRTKKDALIVVWTDALYNWTKSLSQERVSLKKIYMSHQANFHYNLVPDLCLGAWYSEITWLFFFFGGGGGGQWDTLLFQPFNPLWWLASEFSLQYHSWIKHLGHENRGDDHQLKKVLIMKQILLFST